MKRSLILLAILTVTLFDINISAKESSVKILPAKPKSGDEITVTFNAEGTALAKADKVEMTAYLCSSKSDKFGKIEAAYSIEMKKENSEWSGRIKSTPLTDCIGILFSNNEIFESNDARGYFIKFYDVSGNETNGSKLGEAAFNGQTGKYLLKIKKDDKLAYEIMSGVFSSNPELKPAYLSEYLGCMKGALQKEDFDAQFLKELELLRTRTDLEDDAYAIVVNCYKSLKMKDKADELEAVAVKKYPHGQTALGQKYEALQAIPELEKKIEYALQMEKDLKGNARNRIGYYQVFDALIKAERFDLLRGLLDKNKELMEDASINSMLAYYLLKANKELELALISAEKSVVLARKELIKPSSEQASYETDKEALQSRKSTLGSYLLTYGDALSRLNKNEEALQQLEEAITLIPFKELQSDKFELYVNCLAANKKYDKAKPFIEDALKNAKATENMKELLKEIYIQKNGNDKGYSEYLSSFENVGKKDAIEKLKKAMINEPAPKFTLKDLAGKNVSLDDFKGKVVVVDFWATWCGFCKASFPGMQKLVTKYENDKDVKLLFIDTRETIDNVHKAVLDFITKSKYTFHVLLDSKNKVIEDFKGPGLPAKFVIDREGNIRFKVVGYPGDENALVEEMINMITMLK